MESSGKSILKLTDPRIQYIDERGQKLRKAWWSTASSDHQCLSHDFLREQAKNKSFISIIIE